MPQVRTRGVTGELLPTDTWLRLSPNLIDGFVSQLLHAEELHEDSSFAYKIKTWFGLDFKLEANQTTFEQIGWIPDLEKFLSVGNSPKSALWATFELALHILMKWS